MKPNVDYTLYLVTDRALMHSDTLEHAVEQAILGGCTLIQLREKDCSSLEFFQIATSIKQLTDRYHIPLLINDRLDVALSVGAAGVHLGQSDIPADVARKLIGADKILGVSVATAADAKKAVADGADYLGVGAMFPTGTKTDADFVTQEELLAIRKAVSVPLVVIGGINKQTVSRFAGTGIDGLAVVSAILSQPDIQAAARELKALFQKEI